MYLQFSSIGIQISARYPVLTEIGAPLPLRNLEVKQINIMDILKQLVYSSTENWTEEKLIQLTVVQLRSLCALCGIPTSGKKSVLIHRIVTLTSLHRLLTPYCGKLTETVGYDESARLAAIFSGARLTQMCKTAGVFYALNKVGKAASLISWRRQCARNGQKFYRETISHIKSRPRQLKLF